MFYQILTGRRHALNYNTNPFASPELLLDYSDENLNKLVIRMLIKNPLERLSIHSVHLVLSQIIAVFANRSLPQSLDDPISCLLNGDFKGSEIVETPKQVEVIMNRVFANSYRLIYSAKNDGWVNKDLIRCLDRRAPTLVLFKSSDLYSFAAFTTIPWKCTETKNKDPESFLFSVDERQLVYKQKYLEYSVYLS